ncbi:hypothetical protein HZC09_02120 [Candidatus Micrarchaeota archaeon]|nr:hypothetical protein [Candidatus Micrarchaeota archaeon]
MCPPAVPNEKTLETLKGKMEAAKAHMNAAQGMINWAMLPQTVKAAKKALDSARKKLE